MATFVRVTRDQSGVVIYVNMDKVILIERSEKYTILKPNNNALMNELVKETPEQILDLIHHERKSQA
jgi:hypothetical protein